MADYKLRLIVEGDDKASGPLGGVNKALDGVEAKAKSVSASLKSFGDSMTNIGGKLTAAVTLPVAGLAVAAVKMASDFNESASKVGVVFGQQSAAIMKWSQNAASAMGLSQQQALEATGTFGNLFKAMGMGQAATVTMSENIVQLAADLASFNNLDPTEVLEKLRAGLTGESEPLKSLGININETILKAKALDMGLLKSNVSMGAVHTATEKLAIANLTASKALRQHGAASVEYRRAALGVEAAQKGVEKAMSGNTAVLDPLSKAQAAYALIMEQSKDAQGDFGRTSDGLANSMRIISASSKDIGKSLGDVLLPSVVSAAAKVKELLGAFTGLDDATKKWIVFGSLGAAAIGPLLIGIGSLAQSIAYLMPFAAALAPALIPATIGLGLLYAAYKLNAFGLRDLTNNGFKRLQAAAPLAGDAIKSVWKQFTGSRDDIGKTTLSVYEFVTALTGSNAAGLTAVNWVTGLATKVQDVKTAFSNAGGGAAGFVAGFQKLTGVDLVAKLSLAKGAISDLFTNGIDTGALVAKLSAALSGIPGMLSTLFNSTDFSAIKTQIVAALGLDKLSFDFTTLGTTITTAISTELSSIDWSTITADFKSLPLWVSQKLSLIDWSTITTTFSTFTSWASTKLSALDWSTVTVTFSTFTSWVSTKLGALDWSTVTTTFDTLKTRVGTLLGGIDFSTISTTFDSFTTITNGLNTSLQGLTAGDGGITKLQNLFLGGLKTVTDTIAGVDENKVASVSISFSESVKAVLGMFTTLSGLGSIELTTETKAISDIVKSVMDLSTSFTKGLDATGIADSAGKFVASYVDKLNAVLTSADIPGVAKSASGLIEAITGQFTKAMKSDAPTEIGKSLGGLASTMVTRLGAVLNDKTLATDLGKSFANIVAGITEGLGNALKGFNSADTAKDVNIQGAIGEFINNFLSGIGAGLESADYSKVFSGFISGFTKSISGMKQLMDDLEADSKIPNGFSAEGINSRLKILKDIMNLGSEGLNGDPRPLTGNGGGFGGPGDKPITASTVTVNASKVDVGGQGGSNWLTSAWGAGDKIPSVVKPDFSALMNDLKTFKPVIAVEPIPPVKVEPIPPVAAPVIPPIAAPVIPPLQAPTIPPVQVAQPGWFGTLLSMWSTVMGTGHNASGTDNWKGGWTWVGENGPELLNLPGGSKVISNDNSKKMIGHMAGGNYDVPYSPNPYMGPYAQQPFGNNFFGTQAGPTFDRLLLPLTQLTENAVPALKAISENTANTNKTLVNAAIKHPLHDSQQAARDKAAIAQKGLPANDPLLKAFAEMQKEGMAITKGFKGTLAEFKGFLEKVPGLFGTSSVTAEDMQAAKEGTYQPKVDEKLRQLRDLSEHGVTYAGLNVQDFKDALGRIGIKASDNLKTLTKQVESAWNDQSLFSDKRNIASLIDVSAVKESIIKQQTQAKQQAQGNANLLALFGLQPEAVKGQAQALGGQIRTDVMDGLTGVGATGKGTTGVAGGGIDLTSALLGSNATITPESLSGLAQSFMSAFVKALTPQKDKDGKSTGIDFGKQFATAINDSLATTTALDGTSTTLLQKITDSFKTIKGVDFIGGIVKAFDTNLADTGSIKALNNVGQKIGNILKQGIADFFATADLAAAVANGVKPGSTGSPAAPVVKLPAQASGTNFWRGGLTRMNEWGGEIVDLPRGSRVYPHDVSQQMAMAGAGGGGQIVINATVNNPIDIEKIAYRVSQIQQRRGR